MRDMSVILITILISSMAYAEGLGTLIEVGRNQSDIQKDYDRETGNFENMKRAIEKGKLKAGESKESVRKSCGEPVVALPKDETSPETWIYKAARSDWFGGEKIYLAFDDKGILTDIKTANEPKEDKE